VDDPNLTTQNTNWEQQIQLLVAENKNYRFLRNGFWIVFVLSYLAYASYLLYQFWKIRKLNIKKFKLRMVRRLFGGSKNE